MKPLNIDVLGNDYALNKDDCLSKRHDLMSSFKQQTHPVHKQWMEGFMFGFGFIHECRFEGCLILSGLSEQLLNWLSNKSEYVCQGILACLLFCNKAVHACGDMLQECLKQAFTAIKRAKLHLQTIEQDNARDYERLSA